MVGISDFISVRFEAVNDYVRVGACGKITVMFMSVRLARFPVIGKDGLKPRINVVLCPNRLRNYSWFEVQGRKQVVISNGCAGNN